MKSLIILNPDKVDLKEDIVYKYRSATRGIVFDIDNKVAVLFKDDKYYSLPGGEVNKGEGLEDAFIRECKEELGCNINSLEHLGETIEFFEGWSNLSNIFTAKIEGEKMDALLIGDEDEDEIACSVKWLAMGELKNVISDLANNGEEGKRFRYKRDLAILNMYIEVNT